MSPGQKSSFIVFDGTPNNEKNNGCFRYCCHSERSEESLTDEAELLTCL